MADPILRGHGIVRPLIEVWTKSSWDDPWVLRPYLHAVRSLHAVSGARMSEADLEYVVGRVRQQDKIVPALYPPLLLQDDYCLITALHEEGATREPLWYGVIHDDILEQEKHTRLSGIQKIKARGLEWLLDRVVLEKTFASANGVETEIGYMPVFNQRNRRGPMLFTGNDTSELIGNRSADVGAEDLYYFSWEDKEIWDAKQCLLRVFEDNKPTNVTWKLDTIGQIDDLEDYKDAFDLTDKSLKGAIDVIASRKRGLGWFIKVTGYPDAETAEIHIFSFNDEDITVGDFTLPANPKVSEFTLPSAMPDKHIIYPLPVKYSHANRPDRIRVRTAKRIKIVSTFSFLARNQGLGDDNLEAGWTADMADNFAALTEDTERSDDRWDDLYSKFVVPLSWDGKAGDGQAGIPTASVSYTTDVLPDGSSVGDVIVHEEPLVVGDKKFERETPFLTGFRYDLAKVADKLVDENKDPADVSYLPLIVLIQDAMDTDVNPAPFYFVDRIHAETHPHAKSGRVSALDERLGVRVNWYPRHHCAGLQDVGTAHPNAELDYFDLIVTGMYEVDHYQHVTIVRSDPTPNDILLDVPVASAEYIRVMPGTIIGCKEPGGEVRRIHAENEVIRDDKLLLQQVAALLKSWFDRPRNPIDISIKYVSTTPSTSIELGYIITDIKSSIGSLARADVNAVVTSREHWFGEELKTVTSTDFLSVDMIRQMFEG